MSLRKKIELTGNKFGYLTVLSKSELRGKQGEVFWNCICDCSNTTNVRAGNLLSVGTISCGCVHKKAITKHGMTKTRTFKSWDSMKQRCLNPKAPDYEKYGGRGITICDRWLENFNNFLSDMGIRPENLTIDRIDVNGNYEPSNCRWATRSLQQRNKTNSFMIEWNGIVKCAADWSEMVGISSKIICERINAGWSSEDTFTKPNRKSKNT